jgi:hypothetical protein
MTLMVCCRCGAATAGTERAQHQGFKEESEWRLVYMRDRDKDKALDRMLSYWIGPRGVEPKLKFNIEHIPGVIEDDLSLSGARR